MQNGIVRPAQFRAYAFSGPMSRRCAGWPAMPVLYIHSLEDQTGRDAFQDVDGQKMLAKFINSQLCDETSTSAGTNAYGSATYECVDFDGCSSPLRFCSHDIPIMIDFWQGESAGELGPVSLTFRKSWIHATTNVSRLASPVPRRTQT